jgi:ABC-type multidrug transport system fused ATPase/permease subunit
MAWRIGSDRIISFLPDVTGLFANCHKIAAAGAEPIPSCKLGLPMASLFGSFTFHGQGKAASRSSVRTSETPLAELDEWNRGPKFIRTAAEAWWLVRPLRWLLAGSFLLLVVNRLCSFAVPVSSRYLIDEVMYRHELNKLPLILGAVIGATLIQSVTTYVLFQRLSGASLSFVTELRMKVQQHVGRLPISFYEKNRTGTIVARIMTDVEGLRNIIGAGLLDFAGGVFTAVIALVILIRISAAMTILTCGILVVFSLFLKKAFGVLRPIVRERSRINAEVTGRLTESVGGVRVVKGYQAEDTEARVFQEGVTRLRDNMAASVAAQSFLSFCSILILGVTVAVIMYLGVREVGAHRLDIGGYVEFTLLLVFMVAPVAMLVSVGTQLTEAFAGLDRTSEVLNELEEDTEPARTQVIGPIVGSVEFRDVTFAYDSGRPVLHGISFQSQPGTVTALVGSSGSGKSTIISLICGFHVAVGGEVLVDGIDLSTVRLGSFRRQLGVVLQETFLFDGTIRENVLFSRPGASSELFMRACRIARVDEFAERFPEQYETVVGERGVKLSGGQRQRLSIARAILADPRILILDEATNSLDSESEAMIQSSLAYLMRGRTTFVIAHRLSTIRRADQILVIEQGRIVERGPHKFLYDLRGRYFELYTRQHGLETNLFLAPREGHRLG